MTENPSNGRAYARAQFTPTTEVGGSLAHLLSGAEIDGLLTTLTKARERLRKATGKSIMPFAVLAESGTGRPLFPEERKNCVVDIPVSQLIGAREGVIVHLGESEDGAETDQT